MGKVKRGTNNGKEKFSFTINCDTKKDFVHIPISHQLSRDVSGTTFAVRDSV